jgi:hypothetical protein
MYITNTNTNVDNIPLRELSENNGPIEDTCKLFEEDLIIVCFTIDNVIRELQSINSKSLKIRIGDQLPYTHDFIKEENKKFILVNLKNLKKEPSYSRCEIVVTADTKQKSRHFVWKKWVEEYRIEEGGSLLWFPVTLFCTNFDTSEKGLPIATMPITAAIGSKFYIFADDTYFGLNTIVSVVWGGSIESEIEETPIGSQEILTYFVSKFAVGGFVDLDGYLYLGVAYTFDFRDEFEDPGWTMLIGLGQKAYNYIN